MEEYSNEVKASDDSLAKVKKDLDASVNDIINFIHATFHNNLTSVEFSGLDLKISQELLNSEKVVVDMELASEYE